VNPKLLTTPESQVVSYLPPTYRRGEMTEQPSRYSIAELLNSGVQPLPDLPDDELAALGKAIGKGPLADPVTLSSDGLLIDGHQRLKAMLAANRTYIAASDVRIAINVTRENAYESAVELNVRRRHLTVEQKADLARKLQRERRWSQGKIAKLFGVSRPAVSQWLAKTASDDDEPLYVEGLDGKAYDPGPAGQRETSPRNPWASGGESYRKVRAALRALRSEPPVGLGAIQQANVEALLADLIEAAEEVQSKMAGDAPG
jgi:ParB-like chromosome segregation protein Spo0J